MADISSIKMNKRNEVYDIKDANARERITVLEAAGGNGVPIAPAFDANTAYGVGYYVIYQNQTYRFNQAHAAGAWNNNHADAVYPVGQYVTAGQESGTTLGNCATAEGGFTTASGWGSHAEGRSVKATGYCSHAEGEGTVAGPEDYPHAEGWHTTASGHSSHAEGSSTTASGPDSHAEGFDTVSSGGCAHAEGFQTVANHLAQHVFGRCNVEDANIAEADAKGDYIEIVGNGTSLGAEISRSNARTLDWSGNEQLQGALYVNTDTSTSTLDENNRVATLDVVAPAFSTSAAYSVGDYVTYNGKVYRCKTTHGGRPWNNSHFVEVKTVGQYVTAGKKSDTVLGKQATAEGMDTTASGNYSHAEGHETTASIQYSHAEGYQTRASNEASHAEGNDTTASGPQSHAEGYGTTALGISSHAEGNHTTANHKSQHVFGEFNTEDTNAATAYERGDYVEIVGNGTDDSTRSNARTLDWDGNEMLAGKLTIGGTNGITLEVDSNGNLKITKGNKSATITLS